MNNLSSHSNYSRKVKKAIPDDRKDEKYYERRKKNNEAAKKSRDARRIREDNINTRMKILESENRILRKKILLLYEEIEPLHAFIIKLQKQTPVILKQNNGINDNSFQSTFFHYTQLCCIRDLERKILSHSTVVGSTSTTTTANDLVILSTLISRLSFILQTSYLPTI